MSKHPPRCRCSFCDGFRADLAAKRNSNRSKLKPLAGTLLEARWRDDLQFEPATVSPFYLDRIRIAVTFSDGRERGYLMSDEGKTWRRKKGI